MSDSALQDLNAAQSVLLGKSKGSSVEPCSSKPVLNGNKCVKKEGNAVPACPDVTNGCEAGVVDIEYIDSENLTDLPDVDTSLSTLLARLDSKDWVKTCEALNNVRQLAIYHKQRLQELLEPLVPLIVKSVKNPRSALCKTALMTCSDIFKAYGEQMVDLIDLLLMPLFLRRQAPVQLRNAKLHLAATSHPPCALSCCYATLLLVSSSGSSTVSTSWKYALCFLTKPSGVCCRWMPWHRLTGTLERWHKEELW